MSDLNRVLKQIIQLQAKTLNTIKQTTIVKEVQNNDYTAFEVFAHDYDIGTLPVLDKYTNTWADWKLSEPIKDSNLDPNIEINYYIPASMTHRMNIRSSILDYEKVDVIVDWGDGNFSSIANGDYVSMKNGDYTIEHTYLNTGKYIIKIYGKDYYCVGIPTVASDYNKGDNLICRLFDEDLPIASNVTSFAQIATYASALLKLDIPSYYDFSRIKNFSAAFRRCYNLVEVNNFDNQLVVNAICNCLFSSCASLKKIKFTFPVINSRGSIAETFSGCNLTGIAGSSLFPAGGILADTLNVNYLFANSNVTIDSKLANILWNNKSINWTNTSTAFINCSDEIRAQVPISWGGTASDDIIEKSLQEKLNISNQTITALEARIAELEAKLS